MSGYIGSTPVPQATQHRESFTATAGQTSFATAGYTPQFVDVYLNGVHLSPADVTATNGSDVVLVACLVNDIVDVVSYTPFEVANQTFTGNNIMTNGDNTTQLTLISTDADANTGPKLDLTRNSASPAANDILGNIRFMGEDSAGNSLSYIGIFGQLIDPTDGSEDGSLEIDVRLAGTNRSRIISNATETVFNDDSVDLDFRVETNGVTDAFLINGGTDSVHIGTGADFVTNTAGTSNVRVGVNAGNSIVSGGNFNVCVGDEAGTVLTLGDHNTLVGFNSGALLLTGGENTLLGDATGDALNTGIQNVAVGYLALSADTKGNASTAVGVAALAAQNFTSSTTSFNTAVGYEAGALVSTGQNNTLLGYGTGSFITTGSSNTFVGGGAGLGITGAKLTGSGNTAIGKDAGELLQGAAADNTFVGFAAGADTTTGGSNTAIGRDAGFHLTTGGNNTFIGHDAGRTGSPGGVISTADSRLILGDENVSACHVQVDWTIASDQRDKTDFTALDLGLDFVNALAPVTYKWDKRSKYGDKTADDYNLLDQTPDGTHKEDWLDIGFKAQEVQVLEDAAGYTASAKKNLTVSTSGDGKQMGLQYSKFVPILVKAVQELSTALDAAVSANTALAARVTTLEDSSNVTLEE